MNSLRFTNDEQGGFLETPKWTGFGHPLGLWYGDLLVTPMKITGVNGG